MASRGKANSFSTLYNKCAENMEYMPKRCELLSNTTIIYCPKCSEVIAMSVSTLNAVAYIDTAICCGSFDHWFSSYETGCLIVEVTILAMNSKYFGILFY